MNSKTWLALVLCAAIHGAAFGEASSCIESRLSAADRKKLLEEAGALAPGAKFLDQPLPYCSQQSLHGLFDYARLQTARDQQADGSSTWILMTCNREHRAPRWSCDRHDQHSISLSTGTGAAMREHEVELVKADGKPDEVDAAAARIVFGLANEVGRDPGEDRAHCSEEFGQQRQPAAQLSDQWSRDGEFSVSRLADEYFVKRNLATIYFRAPRDAGGDFEYHCWIVESQAE